MDPTFRSRFLRVPFSASTPSSPANGDELNEDDVLWTNDDFSHHSPKPSTTTATDKINHHTPNRRPSFPKNSGILAALPESDQQPILYQKPSLGSSSSKAIPRPPTQKDSEYATSWNSVPAGAMRKTNQSAPVNVPVLSAAMAKERMGEKEWYEEEEEAEEEEKLPPHEIVARGSRRSPKTTFSVLEGIGRTLKGRDLRQVRNAVFRQTGFLD